MKINVIIDEEFNTLVEEAWLQTLAGQVLDAEQADKSSELGIVIVGQDEIHRLNRIYLEEDKPTDVISFPLFPEYETALDDTGDLPQFVTPPDEEVHLGEVIISYTQAALQAKEHGHSAQREITVLLIHGILHVLGYDHDIPEREQKMKAREADILGRIEGGSA